ncbi:MAG TPA: transposase [Rhodoferax sp.]
MHTPNSEIQMPAAGRRRARYGDQFKTQVVAACSAPGVSTAAIALANGLNANMLRRWVVESAQRSQFQPAKTTTTLVPARPAPGFLPVKLAPAPPAQAADISIELQHARGAIQIHWPIAASSQCAQWLREVLA